MQLQAYNSRRIFKNIVPGCLGVLLGWGILQNVSVAIALPIQADNSLPESTQVQKNNQKIFKITGGTQQGNNLFHSFSDFSVPQGHTASFQKINNQTKNVFTRVSGGSRSTINGGVELLLNNGQSSSANFFLLNPNGITFKSGAEIQSKVLGSFVASSGNSFEFSNGERFAADAEIGRVPTGELLKIKTGSQPGSIRLDSVTSKISPLPKRSLLLLGGEIQLFNSRFKSNDARIELVSLAPNQSIDLQVKEIPKAIVLKSIQLSNIQLTSASQITIESLDGFSQGGIFMTGESINLYNQSALISNHLGFRQVSSLPIDVYANELTIQDTSFILSNNITGKEGGRIHLNTKELLVDCGTITTNCAIIVASSSSNGLAGSITIKGEELKLLNGGQILSLASDNQNAQAGAIQVDSDRILIEGGFVLRDNWRPSGIIQENRTVSNLESSSPSPIEVRGKELSLLGGGTISSTTFNENDAGNLNILVNSIDIAGNALNPDGTLVPGTKNLPNLPISSGLFSSVDPGATGKGGTISIRSQILNIRDGGKVQAATFGTGQAGQIRINSDRVEISGEDQERIFPSIIFAGSGGIPNVIGGNSGATGAGNDVSIISKLLVLKDRGTIAVGSSNNSTPDFSGAGNIFVQSDQVVLSNQAELISNTASGNGGNIVVRGRNNESILILLLDSSEISTTAGLEQTGGNGGNISLQAQQILANVDPRKRTDGNDITSKAFDGQGGNIFIEGESLIGIQAGLATPGNQQNDIDVSTESTLGTPGTVNISASLVDPSQKLVLLPESIPITPIQKACGRLSSDPQSSLIDSGKGGISKPPHSFSSANQTWEDLRPFIPDITNDISIPVKPKISNPIFLEATRFLTQDSGQIILASNQSIAPSTLNC